MITKKKRHCYHPVFRWVSVFIWGGKLILDREVFFVYICDFYSYFSLYRCSAVLYFSKMILLYDICFIWFSYLSIFLYFSLCSMYASFIEIPFRIVLFIFHVVLIDFFLIYFCFVIYNSVVIFIFQKFHFPFFFRSLCVRCSV